MRIYVGNLSYDVTEEELRGEFAKFGEVGSVSIPTDKYSGKSRGFAFVEMASNTEAEAAIAGLNGKSLKERTLSVSEARPREDRGGGGGSFGDRRGGGSYGDRRGGGGGRGGGRQGRY